MSAAELTIDPTEKWLGAVAYSHSSSEATEKNYRRHFSSFLEKDLAKLLAIEKT
jgi:hypothetical protein